MAAPLQVGSHRISLMRDLLTVNSKALASSLYLRLIQTAPAKRAKPILLVPTQPPNVLAVRVLLAADLIHLTAFPP